MSIRKTLLLAFLLVSLLPSILLTGLAFWVAGDAMRSEIEFSMQAQAATVSQDIDKMLFERLQNARTWRGLEVAQDIRVQDVDKRLSNFLAELKSGYRDVYRELLGIDTHGRIVASSNPADIGKPYPVSEGILLTQNREAPIRLENLRLNAADGSAVLPISAGVPSMFENGEIGSLILLFDWAQIYQILDQSAENGHDLALIDDSGRIIAASSALRDSGLLLQPVPANWITKDRGVGTHDGTPLHMKQIMVGFDRSAGFQQFPGFKWTTLVIENSSEAFVPVQHMALVFLLLLAFTSSLAVAISLLVANRISRPIARLTDFTRRFRRDKTLPEAPAASGGEVGELTEAFVQTVRDLDQSQADLVRASKLAVLGELAAVMAHEIRTPVGILRSSAQMLAREPDLSPEAQELTGFIGSETERLNRLVTTLLDSARPRTANRQPTDFNALVRHCLELLSGQAEKKSIHLAEQLEASDPVVSCDAEQMTQVLLNLILNALQIVPSGGHVSVACKVGDGKLILEVADDGPGIPPEETERIFDPFFTKREGGVGLGLAVVQQIIAAHHGEIRAGKSALGGALFTITLPVEEPS